MKRKILSLLLCACLVVGLFPTAFAGEDGGFVIENGVLVSYTGSGGVVNIPSGVTEIGERAFDNLGKAFITALTIPEGCVKIGDEAFYFLGELSPSVTVTLPSTLREIGSRAFECAHITEIRLPQGLTYIGDEAFCQSLLTSVHLPASLTYLGSQAFDNCSRLTSAVWEGHTFTQAELSKYFFATPFYYSGGSGGDVEPEPEPEPTPTPGPGPTPDTSSSFTIENGVLTRCLDYGAVTVTVPEGVTAIGEYAFVQCSRLQRVTLPGTLRTIGIDAFRGSPQLRQIDIPDSVTSIGGCAFTDCPRLASVKLPAGLTKLGEHAFQNCSSLTQITLPAKLTDIGDYAFSGCSQLKSVNFPASLTRIGDNAFSGAALSGAVTLPSGLKVLGGRAFSDTAITSITLPDGMDSIGSGFVSGCESLTAITFPKTGKAVEGMRSMEPSQFGDLFVSAPNLKEVRNIPNAAYEKILQGHLDLLAGMGDPKGYLAERSETIVSKAKEITAGLSDDYEKARAIHQWAAQNIVYDYAYVEAQQNTPGTTYFSAEGVLQSKRAICSGYSNLTRALLQAVGIPAAYVHGWVGSAPDYYSAGKDRHAWNLAYVNGRWIILDSTWGRPGGNGGLGGQIYDYRYFDASPIFMAQTHKVHSVSKPSAGEVSDPITDKPQPKPEDIPSGWAKDIVSEAIRLNLVPEDIQGAYRTNITRQDFCRLLVRLVEQATGKSVADYLASKGISMSNPFTDTNDPDIVAANALKIVNGMGGTIFAPNDPISREQTAAMLCRVYKELGGTVPAAASTSFADDWNVAKWAKAEVAFMASKGIIEGKGNNLFDPKGNATIEQAIKMELNLFRLME